MSPRDDALTQGISATERLYRIVQESLCVGCGLCASIAGHDVIQMRTTSNNYERPHVVSDDLTHELVDEIYDTCPGLRQDSLPRWLIDEDTIVDPIWGPYKYMVSAHASNEEVRIKAATGGVLTALAMYLVESGQVDFILHATPSKLDVTFGVPQLSITPDDVKAGSGSIYGPTASLKNISAVLDRNKPFAFIGLPCDISALRNFARYDDRINSLIKFWLTPVCGGIVPPPQLDLFLASRSTHRHELKWFKYRGDMCPGETAFETKDGRTEKANMYEPYGGIEESSWQLPFRCKICPDGPGEGADIAAGDQWVDDEPDWEFAKIDKGSNAMIIRTSAGATLMSNAVEAGYLTVEREITPRFYDTCQHHQVVKKLYTRARWDGLAAQGRLVPRSRGLRLDEFSANNDDATNAAQTEGTRQRIRNGVATEPTPEL